MRSFRITILLIGTWALLGSRLAMGDEDPVGPKKARQIWKAFQEQYSSLAGLRIQGTTSERYRRGQQPNGAAVNDFVLAFDRGQKRWRYALDAYLLETSANGVASKRLVDKAEFVSDGTKRLDVDDDGSHVSVASVSKGGTEPLAGVHPLNWEPSIAFGYLPGVGDLSELEAVSELIARTEMLDGVKVVFLSGKSRTWRFSFWLDPGRKYVPRKISAVRDRERIQLSDVVECEFKAGALIEKAGHFFPNKYQIEVVLAGGTPAPPPKDSRVTFQRAPGQRPDTRMTADVELSEVEVTPRWTMNAFAPQTKIQNGTRVQMLDAPQLNYQWVDGKVVPGN